MDSSESTGPFVENFYQAINFYEKNNKYFDKNKKILLAITRIYKRFADIKKIIFNLKKLINLEKKDPLILCSYIYHNSFQNDWKQNDFLENSKLLNDHLPKFLKSN